MKTSTPVEPSAGGGDASNDGGPNIEVVASGHALSIVSRWLGMTPEEALAEAGPTPASQAAVPVKRPQFLGLGAKYLPHHKAVETATALDSKLRKCLERGLASRRAADDRAREEEQGLAGRRGWVDPNGAGGGKTQRSGASLDGVGRSGAERKGNGPSQQAARPRPDTPGEDSEDEELGKAALHRMARAGPQATSGASAGPRQAPGEMASGLRAAGGPVSKAAREAALLYAPVQGSDGRKRKKHKPLSG